jgi:hypothetical protein
LEDYVVGVYWKINLTFMNLCCLLKNYQCSGQFSW